MTGMQQTELYPQSQKTLHFKDEGFWGAVASSPSNFRHSCGANVPGEPRITQCALKSFAYLEPHMMEQACNLRTWKVEAGGRSGVKSSPQLHSEFKANLSYLGPFLRKLKKQTNRESVCLLCHQACFLHRRPLLQFHADTVCEPHIPSKLCVVCLDSLLPQSNFCLGFHTGSLYSSVTTSDSP